MSAAQIADEETPLLHRNGSKSKTPLPWFQFSIALVLQLAEPMTSNVIYPFAPQVRPSPLLYSPLILFIQLIRDIGITHGNESQVAYYVGIMVRFNLVHILLSLKSDQQSLFFLTQACTVLHWSRTSDVIGRKPVILIGLFGLSASMYCFGLSKTFWGLVVRYVPFL